MHLDRPVPSFGLRFKPALLALLLHGAGGAAIRANPSAPPSINAFPVMEGSIVHTLSSAKVGDSFKVYVRLPPEAAEHPERTFPVVYTLDGDHTFPLMVSAATEVGWSGAVPPVIIVGIGWGTLDLENGNHRSRDLSPQSIPGFEGTGGGPAFLSFLTTEVFPWIEANFPADTEQRYLYGHSLGGLFALYAYAKEADQFAGIIAGSPFLADQLDFLNQVAAARRGPRACRLFVTTGEQEVPDLFLQPLDRLRELLASNWAEPESYEIVLQPGFDHFTMVAPSISRGLSAIFTMRGPATAETP